MRKEYYELHEQSEIGQVPKKTYAWTLREENLGAPIQAFKKELIDIPVPQKDEIIVMNVACGINYNGVWAALGTPRNVVKAHYHYEEKQDFLICGSESSGIVYAVGSEVTKYKPGDEVICIGIQYDSECEIYQETKDPRVSPSFRIWGYEGNWGAFSQFSKVKETQCLLKPKEISWEIAAGCIATGGTVFNMLTHWKGNELKPGDVVLVWGAYGGVGSIAIPVIKALGGIAIAVVSDDTRGQKCIEMGAKGYINRSDFDHWGAVDEDFLKSKQYNHWMRNVLKFRRKIWDIVGEKKNPQIILEHPGASTLPTSIFLCDKKGMVVICGATTGYTGTLDLRYLWLGIKRLQGAHAGLLDDADQLFDLMKNSNIKASINKLVDFDEIPQVQQDMYENKNAVGNAIAIINREVFYRGEMQHV